MTILFKIHYFLWFGAHTGIFRYESVYAEEYTNATTVQFGTLKMILPFIAVVVTPVVCSIADRKRAHRLYFTLSLLLTTLTMLAYLFLPLTIHLQPSRKPQGVAGGDGGLPLVSVDGRSATNETSEWYGLRLARLAADGTRHLPTGELSSFDFETDTEAGAMVAEAGAPPRGAAHDKGTNKADASSFTRQLWTWPFVFFSVNTLIFELAMAVNNCLADSFAVLQAEESGTSFGQVILWGTFGLALSAALLSYINQIAQVPRLLPGLAFSGACLVVDLLLVVAWPRPNDFKLDYIPAAAARSLEGSSSPSHNEPTDYQPGNEANLINLGSELVAVKTTRGMELARQRKTASPVQLARLAEAPPPKERATSLGGPSGVCSEEPPADSRRPTNANQRDSEQRAHCDSGGGLRPATGSVLAGASFQLQLRLFLLIVQRRRSLIRFLALFVLSGFFMAMHWNYFFLYLERTFGARFALISALSMVAQSLLGELPFFMLSQKLIQLLGRSHTLSLSLICIGLRFLVYRFLLVQVSWHCVFLADCLQGPTYSLFYVVMTEVGLEYSFCDPQTTAQIAADGHIDAGDARQVETLRLALRSTVQSVAFACYEGLGVGLGSLAGGLILARHDFDSLWLSMAIAAILIGLANTAIECARREHDPEESA